MGAMSDPAHLQHRGDDNLCEIFNGARCHTYSWSQGHCDLEIRVGLPQGTTHDDICVSIRKRDILVKVIERESSYGPNLAPPTVMGRFQHEIDTESAYWMVDRDSSCLVVYLDKTEEMWWTKLLVHEQPIELGPKNYTVPMDHLDEGARMAVDKLITDQRKKLTTVAASDAPDR